MTLVAFLLLLGFSFFPNRVFSQTDSLVVPDSAPAFQPNPLASGRSSIILPGLGQVRNRQAWKVPIIYGAFAGMGYLIYDNKKLRDKWADYYARSLEGEAIEGFPVSRPATFKNGRDTFDKYYQLSIFGTIAVYLLQGVDAYVSAHLMNFDIDEDLTFKMSSPEGAILTPNLAFTVVIPLD